MNIDEHFDKLTQAFLVEMAQVKCPVEDYQAGLRGAIEEIQTALQASQECAGFE